MSYLLDRSSDRVDANAWVKKVDKKARWLACAVYELVLTLLFRDVCGYRSRASNGGAVMWTGYRKYLYRRKKAVHDTNCTQIHPLLYFASLKVVYFKLLNMFACGCTFLFLGFHRLGST